MLQILFRQLESAKNPRLIEERGKEDISDSIVGTIFFLPFGLLISPIVGVVVGFIFYLLVGIIFWIISKFCPDPERFMQIISGIITLKGCILLFVIATPVLLVLFLILVNISTIKEFKNFNSSAFAKNRRTQAISDLKVKHINELISRQMSSLSQTNSILKSYYNMGILHRDYWGLVPVGTIYSYLDKGLCTKLEGHEGAYLLYENELRWNKVFSKLDDIIDRLDNIQSNQQMLARAIAKSNDKIDRLHNSLNSQLDQVNENLDRINTNQQISNYFGAVSAINTSYLVKLQNDR